MLPPLPAEYRIEKKSVKYLMPPNICCVSIKISEKKKNSKTIAAGMNPKIKKRVTELLSEKDKDTVGCTKRHIFWKE